METGTPNQPVTISADAPLQPASDFHFLRNEAIQWVQKLAGASWTDHNTHDPGITILDLFCYAITDISYRLDYDIKDLLATETGNAYESLYSPAQVLTVNPVTLTDFRKIVLDIDGVQNAWVEKQTAADVKLYYFPDENKLAFANENGKGQPVNLKGIYNISLDPDANYNAVAERLYASRNVCEDFGTIKKLSPLYIAVSGIAEIGETNDVNKTVAAMLFRIACFISPVPRFYSLSEMLAKGKTSDEIFEGPALFHGFIDDEELNSITARDALHTSDIIREMMDESGILRVSNIGIYINEKTGSAIAKNWILQLDTSMAPILDIDETNGAWLGSKLSFRKNSAAITIDTVKVKSYFKDLKNAQSNTVLPIAERDIVPVKGDFQSISNYYSIQNHFPLLYGISEAGLPDSASVLRKAQVKQLKAYLLFFEQILANYLAQAAQLKDLFSFFKNNHSTYFFQPIQNSVPAAAEIFMDGSNDRITGYIESDDAALLRKNRFLDHLLARFGESFEEYALHLQSVMQWLKQNPSPEVIDTSETAIQEKLVRDKLKFLSAYPAISNNRGKAYNYNLQSWNTDNVSGLEERIAAKLGIENFSRRSFNTGEEGFYMIEHILLRPVLEDSIAFAVYSAINTIESFEDAGDGYVTCNATGHGLLNGEQVSISQSKIYVNDVYRIKWISSDQFQIQTDFKGEESTAKWTLYTPTLNTNFLFLPPQTDYHADFYSLQLTFTFPNNVNRFANADFRTFVENTVREETPAHLNVNIYWVDLSLVADPLRFFYNSLEIPPQADILNEMQQASQPFINGSARLAANKTIFRAHRNNLVDKMPVNAYAYPLADIPIIVPGSQAELVVQYNEPAAITLLFSQPDVLYGIYDETGALLNKDINASVGNNGQLTIITTPLTRDNYKVSIEAKNNISNLRTTLFQTLAVRIGINSNLTVFPLEQNILYGKNAVITIKEAQSGTTYRLFDKDGKTALSDIKESINGGDLEVTTKDVLYEDIVINIQASNTQASQSAFLTAKPVVQVYANTDLQPSLENPVADYGADTAIVLNNTQQSASYYLYFKDMDDDSVNKTGLQNTQYVPLSGNGSSIKLPIKNLTEDLTVNVVAKKTNSSLEQWLPDIFIPVKPDAKRALSLAEDNPKAGDAVIILIKNPQRGVLYQLRQVSGSGDNTSYTNIGVPVYYHKNYGVGKARIEIEFVVDVYTESFVALPAGIITKTTTFNVLATKATTSQQAVMDNITITINT